MALTTSANNIPANDEARLSALRKLNIPYLSAEASFDNITRIMAEVFQMPMSFISLVEEDTVYFKSRHGTFEHPSVARQHSICSYTIQANKPLVIKDTTREDVLDNNPYVMVPGGLRFYAGSPLITADGFFIGTVCVSDTRPRNFTARQKGLLANFATQVMNEINLRAITERQSATQKELWKTQEQLRNALEVSGVTPFHWDIASNKVYGGNDLGSLFGVSVNLEEQALPLEIFFKSIHPDDIDYVKQIVETALSTGEIPDAEYRVYNHENKVRWVLGRSSVQFENGQPVSISGSLIDITEKRAASEAVIEKSRELEFVTENLPHLVWATNTDGTVYYFNEQWVQYTGVALSELLGDGWVQVIHAGDQQKTLEVWNEARTQKHFYEVEYRVRRFDGKYRWFLARGTPMTNSNGEVLKWYGTTTDIHDRKMAEEDQRKFRYMADNAQDPFILMRSDGSFAHLNPKALQAWGYTANEASHLRVPDVDAVIDDKAYNEIFEKVLKGFVPKLETLHKRKNGEIYPVEVNMSAVYLDGQPHMFAVARDITARKMAEEALKQSKERFELITKATQDAIWDWDLITNQVWWNEGFKNLFNYKEADIEKGPESWYNRLHPEEKDRIVAGINEVINSGGTQWLDEYRFKKADGTYAYVFDRAYAIHNKQGKAIRLLGSMQDITTRKQFEETIKQSEARLRLAIESTSLATFELNLDTNQFLHSPRAAEIFGFDPAMQYSNLAFAKGIHPDDAEHRLQAHKIARETGSLFYEARFYRPDGSLHWVRLNGTLVYQQKIPLLIGTILDITKEKQESELLEQKIRERTEELQAANDQLQQFSYAASHDLQEPLRKISLFTDKLLVALNKADNNTGRQLAERIQHTSIRMRLLINDLLDFSKTSIREIRREVVNVNLIIADVVDDLEASVTETFTTMQIATLPNVTGDKLQLRQLFFNIIGNSIKYRRADIAPHIVIKSNQIVGKQFFESVPQKQWENNFYHILIQDNGIGFNPEYADRIFGLFQRLHAKTDYEGTGIGLAICKKVVDNHHGILWAESEQGVGTTIHILLPV